MAERPRPNRSRSRTAPPPLTARTADRHALYQRAVQAPAIDAAFYARWFEKYARRPLRCLREDFCGTAVLAAHHVLRHRENRALGVDLCAETLAWGRQHNVRRLLDADQAHRLTLRRRNVLAVRSPKADAVLALNFSYSVFKTRGELAAYIRNCHRSLLPGGVLFMDAWGGPDVLRPTIDKTRQKGFVYEWEQRRFDPISHHITCAIHFSFPDGTRLRNAFVYDWRLWTLPELRELFTDAGFQDVHVLWEGTDQRTGGGNGVFRRKEVGDMDEAWICLVVGQKA